MAVVAAAVDDVDVVVEVVVVVSVSVCVCARYNHLLRCCSLENSLKISTCENWEN